MKFFLDSADINEIKKALETGVVEGITTNPSSLSKASGSFKDILREISETVPWDVSAEVVSEVFSDMVEEGEEILRIGKNLVVKLPCTKDGIRACKYFSDKGKKTNMTLCFSTCQALLAGIAGAYYISPFVGRTEDYGDDGIGLLKTIKLIYGNYPSSIKTKILAASIRHKKHLSEAACVGVYASTVPYSLIEKITDDPYTEAGLAIFRKDWQSSKKTIL